ncbi:hypothetical protein, partial [Nocardia carnea]|uniref:hypothetical protein n=1 Tax=Nocardia carnea TaxID=37328 RepID=UPI002457E8B6
MISLNEHTAAAPGSSGFSSRLDTLSQRRRPSGRPIAKTKPVTVSPVADEIDARSSFRWTADAVNPLYPSDARSAAHQGLVLWSRDDRTHQ